MTQSTFSVTTSNNVSIEFEQDATFENFIGQFQSLCSKLLCIVNGTSLHYYSKSEPLPTNIRYDYKQRKKYLTEYYFRDIITDDLYCVFGREAATIFYPNIDEVDPSTKEPSSTGPINTKTKNLSTLLYSNVNHSTNIIIIDKGVKLVFPNLNFPVEIKTYYS